MAVRFVKADNEIDLLTDQSRYVRAADITDVEVVEGNETELLWDALAELGVSLGDSLNANHEHLKLVRARGHVISYRHIRAWLVYETFTGFNATPVITVFRDDTMLTSYTTNVIPGIREPIRVPFYSEGPESLAPPDFALFTFLRPIRTIAISAIR